MNVKSIEEIMEDIRKEYESKKDGWQILRGRDSYGHYDTFIARDTNDLWHLKSEFKNPYRPIGVGRKVTSRLDDEFEDLLSKGEPLPIGEMYPRDSGVIFALGLGRFSTESTKEISGMLSSQQQKIER